MSQISKAVERIKEDIDGKKVLEVACGSADFSICASAFAESVAGIDMVDFRLNEKIHECRNFTFERMDAAAMRYEDGSFDTVVMYNAIAHLEVIENVLAESKRVLKEGGHIDIVSSYKIDKAVIEEKLIPILEESGERYEADEDKTYTYVRIEK